MADPTPKSIRKPLSVRTRFEIFKRDDFQCRYCGRRTPAVVLEVDHVVPIIEGGTDDPINLVTSCWECNSGKSAVPLDCVMDGEDPHERALMLLERERQLREYNEVLRGIRERKEDEGQLLVNYWCEATGRESVPRNEWTWLCRELDSVPAETIRRAMEVAVSRDATKGMRYVAACLRNWKERGEV